MRIRPFVACVVLLFLMINPVSVCAQDFGKKMNSKEIKTLIDSLSKALRTHYIYNDKAEIMASSITKNYKKGIYDNAKNRRELAMQLNGDLQKAHPDKHMHIDYNPDFAKQLETPMTANEEKQERENMLKYARENNFSFRKTEILPANIGYVRWDEFADFSEEALPTMNSAFQFVSNCKAVIIDMRYNGGGSSDMVIATQNYFFTEKVHLNDIIYHGVDTVVRNSDPEKTSFKLSMPIYILTSNGTFSGAEDFTYGMQQANRATIIGDTTGGGAHPTGPVSIGQGFVVGIPDARAPEGKDWEGTGVYPTIPVPSEKALLIAQQQALTDLLLKASDDIEKGAITWALNVLKVSETSSQLDPIVLNKYRGTYDGGLNFYVHDQKLFCKNAERGGGTFELKPISGDLFLLDENVQVKFEKDTTGNYSKIKMFWKDGRVTEKVKI